MSLIASISRHFSCYLYKSLFQYYLTQVFSFINQVETFISFITEDTLVFLDIVINALHLFL